VNFCACWAGVDRVTCLWRCRSFGTREAKASAFDAGCCAVSRGPGARLTEPAGMAWRFSTCTAAAQQDSARSNRSLGLQLAHCTMMFACNLAACVILAKAVVSSNMVASRQHRRCQGWHEVPAFPSIVKGTSTTSSCMPACWFVIGSSTCQMVSGSSCSTTSRCQALLIDLPP